MLVTASPRELIFRLNLPTEAPEQTGHLGDPPDQGLLFPSKPSKMLSY